MATRLMRASGLPIAAAAVIALVLPGHQAQATSGAADVQPRVTGYTWSWSDGYSGTRRTFSERRYGTAARLPALIVRSDCSSGARVGDRIKLQWRNSLGKYRTEDSAYVDSCTGQYRLSFYPYAASGAWARGTYQYRLIVPGGGGYKYFMITYARR
jgi:hypothetical protein